YLTLQIEGFQTPVRFMVAGDISDLIQDRRKFDLVLTLSLLALGVGVLAALVIQIRFGLKPLRGLVHDMEAILQRRANRLDKDYPDEIMPLIHVANSVLEENQNQIERARRHVGNLAHALKTPLTLLRGEASLSDEANRQPEMKQQIDVISNLVEHHLARAATAGASSFSASNVSVLNTATSICQSLEKIFAGENRHGHIDIPPSLMFRGEREDLEEIVGNILENAFKWAKHNIYVKASIEIDGLRLIVFDDGPGMPDDKMQNSLDRGKRLDEMTPGHGLGLSIVADLVALYEGELTLGTALTGGLSVTIVFPTNCMP
ncbi:MAG: sensor histidine kinase, partial [Rhodospirillales bacterium]|nr:sensor histidine kinase [Rhodospirillales bacterium]